MGLIRKALHVATVGAVAPNSKKQRVAKQTLVAIQGGSPSQVRRAGGRYEHGVVGALENARVARGRAVQAPSQPAPRYVHQSHADAAANTAALMADVRKHRAASAEGLARFRREYPDAR